MGSKTALACRASLQRTLTDPTSCTSAANKLRSACYTQISNGYSLTTISRPVGKGQLNRPLDVLAIQRLLNGTTKKYEGQKSIVSDGVYGKNLASQIYAFQKHVVKMKSPDTIISTNGKTHSQLLSFLDPYFITKHSNAAKHNEMYEVDVKHFMQLFKTQFPEETNLDNVETLLNYCVNDNQITDIRWIAYMMATVKRESIGWSASSEEIGKGVGKKYSVEIEVFDPITRKIKKVIYYGRGYCQLTWKENYIKLGKAIGENIVTYPEKSLEPNISYKILSKGMIEGIISGKPLPRFINGAKCDYFQARRTINELDHAQEIADDALKYEILLKSSQKSAYIKQRSAYICF